MTAATAQRDLSLDSFRGTDVLLMILVNVQGNDAAAFAIMKHVAWNGITLADFVFPIFLLIVGLSAPLALDRPGALFSWAGILRRAVLLFAIGVGLSFCIRPTLDPDMIRWTGVLQRIAIVYFICAAVIVARRGIGLAIALSVALLALHSYILLRVGAPSGGGPSMEPGMGMSGWLDQNFIPGRVLRKTWEPEGVLSTLPAIVNALIGLSVMRWMQAQGWAGRLGMHSGNALLGGIAFALIALGMALTPWLPLNKNLWTASFVLVTSGAGLGIWAVLRMLWPVIGTNKIAAWTVSLGQAALTLYIVHTLLIAVIVRKLPSGETIWEASWNMLAGTGLHPGTASMLYAMLAAAISCAALPWLKRRGWILKI
jgi:predicted acyltransferase